MTVHVVLGYAGAVIVAAAGGYYIWDVITGDTRPHSGSWMVWGFIGILGLGVTRQSGAGPGSYAAAAYTVLYLVTFMISLHPRFGKPGLPWHDWPLCALAVAGILTWRLGQLHALPAVLLAITCDAVAWWMTLRETWRDPASESRLAWAGDTLGTGFCLLAMGHISFAAMAYPAYLFGSNATVAAVTTTRRRRSTASSDNSMPTIGDAAGRSVRHSWDACTNAAGWLAWMAKRARLYAR